MGFDKPKSLAAKTLAPKSPVIAKAIGQWRKILSSLNIGQKLHIFLCVSGGADSLAMAATATLALKPNNFTLHAIIVDHGLDTNSAEIAQTAKSQLQTLGIENIHIDRVNLGNTRENLESRARDARYDAFNRVARDSQAQCPIFALAHTLNDQAETVLLGLMRGSGTSAIKGIRPIFGKPGKTYIRPFLNLTRQETEQICHDFNLTYWEDPANFLANSQANSWPSSLAESEPVPLRTQVRHTIIPALEQLAPGIKQNFARTAELATADLDFLEAEATKYLGIATEDTHTLDITQIQHLPDPIRWRVIRNFLQSSTPSETPLQIPFERIREIDEKLVLLQGNGGATIELEGLQIRRQGKTIFKV